MNTTTAWHMRKLKFDRNRYGNGLLIDSVDMTGFDRSIVEAVPDFHVIGAVEQGRGILRVGMHDVTVRPGTLVLIAPGHPVDLGDCEIQEATWLFFEAGFMDAFFEEAHFTYRFSFFSDLDQYPAIAPDKDTFQRCDSLIQEIHRELRRPAGDSEPFLRAALHLLLVRLQRANVLDHPHAVGMTTDARIQRLRYLLANKVAELRTVEAFASELGMSRSHLNTLVQRHFARSAKELIEDHRMMRARRALLLSNADVATIAYDLGYSDPSNFARSFRRHSGLSPEACRSRATN